MFTGCKGTNFWGCSYHCWHISWQIVRAEDHATWQFYCHHQCTFKATWVAFFQDSFLFSTASFFFVGVRIAFTQRKAMFEVLFKSCEGVFHCLHCHQCGSLAPYFMPTPMTNFNADQNVQVKVNTLCLNELSAMLVKVTLQYKGLLLQYHFFFTVDCMPNARSETIFSFSTNSRVPSQSQ